MLSIHLHQLQFFAYHGIYEEERVSGNQFEVDIRIDYQPESIPVKHLSDSIDYVQVYDLVNMRMSIATPLLETLVTELADQILATFLKAEVVFISIKKLHPPIPDFKGSVGVSFELKRK